MGGREVLEILVEAAGVELEAFSGRERSGSPLAEILSEVEGPKNLEIGGGGGSRTITGH